MVGLATIDINILLPNIFPSKFFVILCKKNTSTFSKILELYILFFFFHFRTVYTILTSLKKKSVSIYRIMAILNVCRCLQN